MAIGLLYGMAGGAIVFYAARAILASKDGDIVRIALIGSALAILLFSAETAYLGWIGLAAR